MALFTYVNEVSLQVKIQEQPLVKDLIHVYSAIINIVNVVIFVAYSPQCTIYFKMCGQPCLLQL